jgi:hypothetical protein
VKSLTLCRYIQHQQAFAHKLVDMEGLAVYFEQSPSLYQVTSAPELLRRMLAKGKQSYECHRISLKLPSPKAVIRERATDTERACRSLHSASHLGPGETVTFQESGSVA